MAFKGVKFPATYYSNLSHTGTTIAGGSNQGIASYWYRSQYYNAFRETIFYSSGGGWFSPQPLTLQVGSAWNSCPYIKLSDSWANTNYLDAEVPLYPIVDDFWHHVLFTWDIDHTSGSRIVQCAVDGFLMGSSGFTVTEAGSAFTLPSFTYMAVGSSSTWMAEFYINLGEFLDLTDPDNIAKFVSGGGPVDLGIDGSLPTGTQPVLYLHAESAANDFLVNRGTAAFTFTANNGGITLADRDPSLEKPITVMTYLGNEQVPVRLPYTSGRFSQYYECISLIGGTSGVALLDGLNGFEYFFGAARVYDQSQDIAYGLIVQLNDDGQTYTSTILYSTFAGSAGPELAEASFANHVVQVAVFNVFSQQIVVWPLTEGTFLPNRVNLDSGNTLLWDTSVSKNFGWTTVTPILDDSTEKAAVLFDMTVDSGQAVLIDTDSNITTKQIYDGYSGIQNYRDVKRIFIVPNADDGVNHILMLSPGSEGYRGGGVHTTLITADATTGEELSRNYIHFPEVADDKHLQALGTFSGFGVSVSLAPDGFYLIYGSGYTCYWMAADGLSYKTIEFIPQDAAINETFRMQSVTKNSNGIWWLGGRISTPSALDSQLLWSGGKVIAGVQAQGEAAHYFPTNNLKLVSLYPMNEPANVYAITNDNGADFSVAFSQLSISLWCCKTVNVQGPTGVSGTPSFVMNFQSWQVSFLFKDESDNVLFTGTFTNPGPITNTYHIAFSLDTVAQTYTFRGNGRVWTPSVSFPTVGSIKNTA